MKDSLFGLDRAGTEDGMRLRVTVNDNAVLDAYRNGTPVEEDGADGARTEPDADTDGED